MLPYNSSFGLTNQNDSDITIINPSIIDGSFDDDDDVNNTYVPILTRLKEAKNSSEIRQTPMEQSTINNNNNNNNNPETEYILVDPDPIKNAQNLEKTLKHYIQDLKQENNTQLDCDKQLVIRLMDSIRLAYINDQQKMIQLDKIMEEIGFLHDKRHLEQQEKLEKLRTENCQLHKILCIGNTNNSLVNENIHQNTTLTLNTMPQRESLADYNQWTEIEGDAKQLQELVQSQKNKINEIVSLISETIPAPISLKPADDNEITPPPPPAPISPKPTDDNQITPPSPSDTQEQSNGGKNSGSSLLDRIQHYIRQKPTTIQSETGIIPPSTNPILINHSPGISPTNSLATLISDTLRSSISTNDNVSEEQINKEQPDVPPIIPEPYVPPITPEPYVPPVIPKPVVLPSPVESKKCPVCNHEFDGISDDVEMYMHIDKCLFPTGNQTKTQAQTRSYECPKCAQKYTADQEKAYHQHMHECFNRDD